MNPLALLSGIFGDRGLVGSVTDILKGAGVLKDPEMEWKVQQALLEYELKIRQMDLAPVLGQIDVNKVEAQHEGVFIAGWRPFIGWVCGSAFAYHYVGQPIILFTISVFHWTPPAPIPSFDMTSLMTVLMGMLGLGSLRSWEKFKGVNTNRGGNGA